MSSCVLVFRERAASLKWFADRGHRRLIAGYYDQDPAEVTKWLAAANEVGGRRGDVHDVAESVRGP